MSAGGQRGRIRVSGTLAVAPRLRPINRRCLIAPGIEVALYQQVDRSTHYAGWGYDLVDFISVELAEALPIEGEA